MKRLALLLLLFLALAGGRVSDPYKILGLTKSATDDQIKRAYRKLALKYHPDKAGDSKAAKARFMEIQSAYDTLGDPASRRAWDSGTAGGPQWGSSSGGRSHSHYSQQQGHHYEGGRGGYEGGYDAFRNFHFGQFGHGGYQEPQLPSNTTTLTLTNFAPHVFWSRQPWLILIYGNSRACVEASPVWEATWHAVGRPDANALLRMGRVHWRQQHQLTSHLLHHAMNLGPFGFSLGPGVSVDELPIVLGSPVGCGSYSCIVRHRGPFTLGALQDFAGDKLLHLPRIQQVYPGNLEIFLANTPPTKVVALVMARSGGGGSLALRAAVHALRYLVDFARVNLADPGIGQQDKEASAGAQLQALLRLQQAPPHNSIVFLRGPGLSLPHVLPLQPGDVRKLDELITSQGLIYHTMPPLRKLNAEGMGCTAARDRAEGAHLCVVVMAPAGPALDQARRALLQLSNAVLQQPSSALARQYVSGKLRLTFMDATTQQPFCRFHYHQLLHHSSAAAATGAGQAQGGDTHLDSTAVALHRAQQEACGYGWLAWLQEALAQRSAPGSGAYLLAFRPHVKSTHSASSSLLRILSLAGGSRGGYLFSMHLGINLAQPGELDAQQLGQLVSWMDWVRQADPQTLAAAQAQGKQQPDAAAAPWAVLPDPQQVPGLLDDTGEEGDGSSGRPPSYSLLEFLALKLSGLARLLLFSNWDATVQGYATMMTAVVMLIALHLIWYSLMAPQEQSEEQQQEQEQGGHSGPADAFDAAAESATFAYMQRYPGTAEPDADGAAAAAAGGYNVAADGSGARQQRDSYAQQQPGPPPPASGNHYASSSGEDEQQTNKEF